MSVDEVLDERNRKLCGESPYDFGSLRALFVNCTLKRSAERSHTQGLVDLSAEIMRRNGVEVEVVRAADHTIPPGSRKI